MTQDSELNLILLPLLNILSVPHFRITTFETIIIIITIIIVVIIMNIIITPAVSILPKCGYRFRGSRCQPHPLPPEGTTTQTVAYRLPESDFL
jgi:hypothetical protein